VITVEFTNDDEIGIGLDEVGEVMVAKERGNILVDGKDVTIEAEIGIEIGADVD
jgi:hypothetical protein